MERKRAIKAGAAIVVGALLIGSGATLATWDKTTSGTDATIQAGGLSLEIDPDVQVYDVSPDAEDNGQEIDPATFEVVPGDTIRIVQDIDVSLQGNNIYARLGGSFTGSAGDLNLTSVVKLVDGIGSPTAAIPVNKVLAEANSTEIPEEVTFERAGEFHYQIVREVTFPNVGKNLDSVSASSVVSGSTWTLTQDRRPTELGPSVLTDPELTSIVRTSLGIKPYQPVSAADVLKVKTLDASGRGITTLAGLESATSLTSLNVSGNAIKDLTPLKDMKLLETLDISSNGIATIQPISTLSGLTKLSASNNNINFALGWVALLPNLKSLDISSNKVRDSDMATLAPLKLRLTELTMHHNLLTNVNDLKGFTKLTKLDASYNSLTDTINFGTLASLNDLKINNNRITNITLVAMGLKTIDVSSNRFVTGLAGISSNSVTKFNASNNMLISAGVPGLSSSLDVEVDVSRNNIKDVTGIVNTRSLTRKLSIDITYNGLSSLSGFSGYDVKLGVLNIGAGNSISNISSMSKFYSADKIIFTGNGGVITDWTPLKNLAEGVVVK